MQVTSDNLVPTDYSSADLYPSRNGQSPALLERLEPVVHASTRRGAPIPPVLVQQYEKDGFLVLENVFNKRETKLLQAELERLRQNPPADGDNSRASEDGDSELRSIFAVHETNALFRRLACDSRLVELARFLLDDEVYIYQSRLNYKPGFRGREFYWHSDFETWHVEDGMPAMRAVSMSVTLTDNSHNNGPLMLIPGSHKRYVCCPGLTPAENFRRSLRKQEYGVPPDDLLRKMSDEGGIVTADAQPGSVIVFDCNTMHGSNGNITPYSRSNAFFVYNAIRNKALSPFCGRPPRPEFLCTRSAIRPLAPRTGELRPPSQH